MSVAEHPHELDREQRVARSGADDRLLRLARDVCRSEPSPRARRSRRSRAVRGRRSSRFSGSTTRVASRRTRGAPCTGRRFVRPNVQSSRCSMKSRMPASAHCTSSKTRTSVRRRATASRKRLQATNAACRWSPWVTAGASSPTSERRWDSMRATSAGSRTTSRHRSSELRRCDCRRVGLEDPGLRLDDLAERPVGEDVAVRRRVRLPPADEGRTELDPPEELEREPALSDAGLPDERDELRGALAANTIERFAQHPELALSPDERLVALLSKIDAAPRTRSLRLPDEDRLGLPLRLDRLRLADTRSRGVSRGTSARRRGPSRPPQRTAAVRRCS